MTTIAHISDLHFGAESAEAVSALSGALDQISADIVIVTGDLTQGGRRREFERASAFLSQIRSPVFVVPGNHDVPVRNLWARFIEPYARFERYVGDALNPLCANGQMTVLGLNSARRAAPELNWSFGRLSQRQILDAAEKLRAAPQQSLKAVALHHPLKLGPGTAGSRIVGRGREALIALSRAGLDIAFTGHVHHSHASVSTVEGRGVVIVEAGTATSNRTRGEPPAFNVVRNQNGSIRVEIVRFTNDRFTIDNSALFAFDRDIGWASV